jgi:hypothetical protein
MRGFVWLGAVTFLGCVTPDIKPPVLAAGTEKANAEHGAYLVRHVAACLGCHSQRDFTHMAGPYREETAGGGGLDLGPMYGFPSGTVMHGPNVTPDALRSWSDGEVARAMVSGLSRDGHALFPVMPYDAYNTLGQDDVVDMIAFLRTLPPQPGQVPARKLSFPLNLVVKKLPREPQMPLHAPRPGDAGYGAYLTNLAGCMWCHTQVDNRGRLVKGTEFSGGHAFPVPAPGGGTVVSANLTPDAETGLGAWTREVFIARFKAVTREVAQGAPVEVGAVNTVMDWTSFSGMTEEDLGAIFDHLRTLPARKNAVVKYPAKTP